MRFLLAFFRLLNITVDITLPKTKAWHKRLSPLYKTGTKRNNQQAVRKPYPPDQFCLHEEVGNGKQDVKYCRVVGDVECLNSHRIAVLYKVKDFLYVRWGVITQMVSTHPLEVHYDHETFTAGFPL